MIPSRYMLIDERSSYMVKRRVRDRRYDSEKKKEPAITLLPPDPYMIMERPTFTRSSSPTMYRTAPPKSAKNKEASSFVILGDTIRTPVQSRPESPSGRISPFRGHGFKSPMTTRPNSRAPSPSDFLKKDLLTSKPKKPEKTSDRPRIGRDIGLPPKSPIKSKSQNSEILSTTTSSATTLNKVKAEEEKTEVDAKPPLKSEELETAGKNQITTPLSKNESSREKVSSQTTEKQPKSLQSKQQNQELSQSSKTNEKLMAVTPKGKRPLASPTPKTKTKTGKKEENNQESVIKKATKPPLPPKKVGLKTILKSENTNENGKMEKEGNQEKISAKENAAKKNEVSSEDAKPLALSKQKDSTNKEIKENSKEIEGLSMKENEKSKVGDSSSVEEVKKTEDKSGESKISETKTEEKGGSDEKKPEKLVPCFQPDKCQIAPPTMASPSPIITPTISTPSTTADLTSSSMKNSQSIASAPTTVTPSSPSSVSSTVVFVGNPVRNEIENKNTSGRSNSEKTDASAFRGKETRDSNPPDKVSNQMVKADSKDSLKWREKDSLSKEVTSTTKIIKAEPDMEVLSPNNLRDSPPRMPPPNLAWDEGRLPNGDIPTKTESESKFRRFVSALCRFLSCIFCCRCFSARKCCPRSCQDGIFSKSNCCKGKTCRNPFECCTGRCKPKCCEGKKCCRSNSKLGNHNKKSQKCCAKVNSSCRECCDKLKAGCLNARYKLNNVCRSLFCLNLTCCQKILRKFKFCHKLKCCQKNGFCSCCNPNVKKESRKLNKKGSRASSNSSDKDNLDVVLVEHTSLMKAAIPVLPSCLAAFCLILNLLVPGFGTFVSGILCLCFGKPRFSVKDTPKNRVGSFILNTIIAIAQLFTVVFCLVGWGWSIWWGVIIYKLSRRQKRLKLAEKNQKEVEGSNVNHNHVDVEQG